MKARIREAVSPDQAEREEKRSEKYNRRYLNYAHRCLLLSLRESGFGESRLHAMSRNSYDVGEEYMETYRDRQVITPLEELLAGANPEYKAEDFFETVKNTYWALRRDLLPCGFDPEIALWPSESPFGESDFVLKGHLSLKQRQQREAYLFYANEMSRLVLAMLCMGAKELHRTNGLGAMRLSRIMEPVKESWFRLMHLYLSMDMRAVEKEQKRILAEFNAMGCFPAEYTL